MSPSIVSSVVVETLNISKRNEGSSDGVRRKQGYYLQNKFGFATPLVWSNIIMIVALHLYSAYAIFGLFLHFCKLETFIFGKST